MNSMSSLPPGLLLAWYGDDFTGTAAVMEVLSFAGLPSMVFLQPPSAAQRARFPHLRGIGIAGTARSETPDWMRRNLPAMLKDVRSLGAPFLHYKICSTLDSAPTTGSIGVAMDVAVQHVGARLLPVYPSAVPMRRYQAFGNLFAAAPGGIFRLDRHPVMARHPVTPMDEADVRRHLARQTDLPIKLLDIDQLHAGMGSATLASAADSGACAVAIDSVSEQDQAEVGRILWERRGGEMVCFGSQGVEYALVAYWQQAGLIPQFPSAVSAGEVGPIAVVSGSVSPVTAAQIDHASASGFHLILADATDLAGDAAEAEDKAVRAMLAALARGQDAVVATARGPDDPAVERFRQWLGAHHMDPGVANRRIGQALGRILRRAVLEGGVRRTIISGGDTSGHAARELGIDAIEALAPTIPGAALSIARCDDPAIDGLQIALKGGQMGTEDFFRWVKQGGGERRA